MKMIYNGTPIKSLNIKHYEMNTNSATMVPSDLQAGVTAFAKGKKVTGTGKSFEFANYGQLFTNASRYVPTNINVIEVASTEYPVKLNLDLLSIKNVDFSNGQKVATIIVNNNECDLVVSVQSNIMKILCDENVQLEVFYGKDNYAMSQNQRIQQLEYDYAQIDPSTGRCISVFTSSYQIPIPEEYILIPEATIAYNNKYYNAADGLWYLDAEFTQLWADAPQW